MVFYLWLIFKDDGGDYIIGMARGRCFVCDTQSRQWQPLTAAVAAPYQLDSELVDSFDKSHSSKKSETYVCCRKNVKERGQTFTLLAIDVDCVLVVIENEEGESKVC